MTNKPEKIDPKIIGSKTQIGTFTFDEKGFIIYALGIGFSRDPLKAEDLKFTYELDDNFSTFPTIASCIGQEVDMRLFLSDPLLPEFPISAILHGEEKLYMIHKKLKAEVPYKVQREIIDVLDKGPKKGAFIISRFLGYQVDSQGNKDLAYYIDRSTFIRTLGGSGIKSTGKSSVIPNKPNRPHEITVKDSTFANQTILYRLVSDPNPLHVDSNMAAMGGFPKPILHGLATHGTVVRAITQNLLGNDPERIKSVEVRFTGHVFPGESLEIKLWKEEGNKYYYEVEVVERKAKAISGVLTVRQAPKL